MNVRLGLALAGSALVHLAAALPLAALDDTIPPRPRIVPFDVSDAPKPPPPPEPSPPSPPPTPNPTPKPHPHPRPHPHPAPTPSPADLPIPVADAGVDLDASPAPPDAGAAPVDPAVADLRTAVPPGERVVVVLRADRLRGTPWADATEALLAPMPDHRRLLGGSGLGLADTFDLVVIASSEPRDVAQTFLAARTAEDVEKLQRVLGTHPPTARDPRVLTSPAPGWLLLIRPELLGDGPPPWLDGLEKLDALTADPATIAVVTVGDPRTKTLVFPGAAPLPAPDRVTVAVSLDEKGFILRGAAVFPDAAAAQAFRTGVEALRAEAASSMARRILLRTLGVDGAVGRLAFAQKDGLVTFSTSLSTAEAVALLDQAAELARRFFQPAPPDSPSAP